MYKVLIKLLCLKYVIFVCLVGFHFTSFGHEQRFPTATLLRVPGRLPIDCCTCFTSVDGQHPYPPSSRGQQMLPSGHWVRPSSHSTDSGEAASEEEEEKGSESVLDDAGVKGTERGSLSFFSGPEVNIRASWNRNE